jgi:hypothetical protein
VVHLWQVMGERRVANVRLQLAWYNAAVFENYTPLKPTEDHAMGLSAMRDKLNARSGAMMTVR